MIIANKLEYTQKWINDIAKAINEKEIESIKINNNTPLECWGNQIRCMTVTSDFRGFMAKPESSFGKLNNEYAIVVADLCTFNQALGSVKTNSECMATYMPTILQALPSIVTHVEAVIEEKEGEI